MANNPTINANFPSLEDVMNLVRAICNDSFAGYNNVAGEGQILTDDLTTTTTNNPFILNHLNSAIRELYRKIRITGDSLLIKDNYIVENLSTVSGPLGPSVADPTVQVRLDSIGFWNGSSYDNQQRLPDDMYLPLRLWERSSGTTDAFIPIMQAPDGLSPSSQVDRMGYWEYRGGAIWFPGATTNRDVRIRYLALFPTFFNPNLNFAATYIPVLDCQEFVAYKTSEKITLALGNPTITTVLANTAAAHLSDIKNERVRRMQRISYHRAAYDDGDTGQELDVYGI